MRRLLAGLGSLLVLLLAVPVPAFAAVRRPVMYPTLGAVAGPVVEQGASYTATCFTAAADGSLTWQPAGPFDRDVVINVTKDTSHRSDGGCDPVSGIIGTIPLGAFANGYYEPAYYDGAGGTYPANAYNWPFSWSADDVVIVQVGDYGPCAPTDCPDTPPTTRSLPSGWHGIPAGFTDGTFDPSAPGPAPQVTALAGVFTLAAASARHSLLSVGLVVAAAAVLLVAVTLGWRRFLRRWLA